MEAMLLVNWNVNGIRSIMKKDFIKDITTLNPDILLLQETKASYDEVHGLCELFPEYKTYVNSSKTRKGYSGTAILTKKTPLNVTFDMNIEEHDQEGRVIAAEFDDFYIVTVYVPNSGEGLKRLDYRQKWNSDFTSYVDALNSRKPVIIGGDLNVAHKPIDIARAKENFNKSAGYTQVEIDGFDELLGKGFTDSFRHFYPEEVKYTYWNQMFNSRARNRGWRIDYFLVSNLLVDKVRDAEIHNDYFGSDHCPIALKLVI